jgi:hypothetical protein
MAATITQLSSALNFLMNEILICSAILKNMTLATSLKDICSIVTP